MDKYTRKPTEQKTIQLLWGMTPPDKSHTYELHVFALDKKLCIENGFYLNELWKQMDGHIIEEAVLKGIYEKVPF